MQGGADAGGFSRPRLRRARRRRPEPALPVLRHRVILSAEAEVEGHTVDELLGRSDSIRGGAAAVTPLARVGVAVQLPPQQWRTYPPALVGVAVQLPPQQTNEDSARGT